MGAICEHCREVLIREEREEGNLCFECFEAQVLETTPEDGVMEKMLGGGGDLSQIRKFTNDLSEEEKKGLLENAKILIRREPKEKGKR